MMTTQEFDEELLMSDVHKYVYFRHYPFDDLHVINKIERSYNKIVLKEDCKSNYKKYTCLNLSLRIEEMDLDDDVVVLFSYINGNGKEMVCQHIDIPFEMENDDVIIEVSL